MASMVAAEGAAAATVAATGAFKYNRENYLYDMEKRYERFNIGYNMAIAQVSQYREDIRDLTEFTVTKMDTYHTVGVIFFVLNFQLIMAGRLGVHGPAPPGWIMGLYWTNICSALMFLVTFTWLAMHASARATAGGAHMLTRRVRLPVPTPKQMDKARVTGNSYEKQRVRDVFRVPFVAPAPREETLDFDEESGKRARKVPRWYEDEVRELHAGGECSPKSPTSNPEHFELYRGLQEEWWSYEVYARVGLLYFMSHWLTAAGLYSICHCFTELRVLWPAWTVVPSFAVAHYCVLSLDIVHTAGGNMYAQVEKFVPFVPVFAVLGMSIDYSVLPPAAGWRICIYALSWICYGIQFAWALRLFQLAAPGPAHVRIERPGEPWWPARWRLPPAFQDAIYLVSAPKHLEPGQTCLLQEMNASKQRASAETTPEGKKAREPPPPMFAWKLFRGACITTICMWLLIMCGRAFEQVNGERQLLKQEHRVERWPSHFQAWMPPWSRHGLRNEYCHAGGCDRRLGQVHEVADLAAHLSQALGPIATALEGSSDPRMTEALEMWRDIVSKSD